MCMMTLCNYTGDDSIEVSRTKSQRNKHWHGIGPQEPYYGAKCGLAELENIRVKVGELVRYVTLRLPYPNHAAKQLVVIQMKMKDTTGEGEIEMHHRQIYIAFAKRGKVW